VASYGQLTTADCAQDRLHVDLGVLRRVRRVINALVDSCASSAATLASRAWR
jgi:hypothetical protein